MIGLINANKACIELTFKINNNQMKLKNLFFEADKKPLYKNEDDIFSKENSLTQNMPLEETLSDNEKQWGMGAHLSAILGYFFPFGSLLGPFLIWQIKKGESKFIEKNAKAALNFQITYALIFLIGIAVYIFLFGYLLINIETILFTYILPFIVYFVIQIYVIARAAGKAAKGEFYKYPLSFKFFK